MIAILNLHHFTLLSLCVFHYYPHDFFYGHFNSFGITIILNHTISSTSLNYKWLT